MQTVTQTVFFESGMSELVITMLPINNMVFATAMLAWKRQLAGTDNNIIITGEIINLNSVVEAYHPNQFL